MIRRLVRNLWRILTAPFRFVARPFVRIYSWLMTEPEDTSAADALSRTIQNPSLLVEHLEALRGHLLRTVVVLAITTGIGFTVAPRVFEWLTQPIGGIEALRAIEITEPINAFMRVSLLTGFALAFPYICLEAFLFVAPGLKRRERFVVLGMIPAAFALFAVGILFAYYVMLPVALPFLLGVMNIETDPRPAGYLSFVTRLLFWIGIAFQFPLVVNALASFGIVRARSLVNGWRIAIVLIAILAAVITPTIDAASMGLVMAPMIVLYFLSILLASFAERGRRRRAQESGP